MPFGMGKNNVAKMAGTMQVKEITRALV